MTAIFPKLNSTFSLNFFSIGNSVVCESSTFYYPYFFPIVHCQESEETIDVSWFMNLVSQMYSSNFIIIRAKKKIFLFDVWWQNYSTHQEVSMFFSVSSEICSLFSGSLTWEHCKQIFITIIVRIIIFIIFKLSWRRFTTFEEKKKLIFNFRGKSKEGINW